MRKPRGQKIVQNIGYIIGGAAAIGFFIDYFSNAISLITVSLSIWVTIFLFVLYLVIWILVKTKKIDWVTKEGRKIKILKLGSWIDLSFFGALLFIWLPNMFSSKVEDILTNDVINNAVSQVPIFDSLDNRYKILILPFRSECEYMGSKFDVGYVISKRLERLNEVDSLNLVVYFLGDEFDISGFSSAKADSLMKFHNASQIIYGSYSLKECESSGKDKICYNYRSDQREFLFSGYKKDDTSYHMVEVSGLKDIRNGSGQENVDNIVYGFAAFSAFSEKQFDKANRIISKIKNIYSYSAFYYLKISCHFQLKDFLVVKRMSQEKLKEDPNNHVYWNMLGLAYVNLNDYENAKECFNKTIELNNKYEYPWINLGLYYQQRTKKFDSAKICFQNALKISPENSIVWRYIGRYYIEISDYKNAKESFENSLKIDPYDSEAMGDLAFTYAKLGDTAYAISCFERVLEIDSSIFWVFNSIGSLFISIQDFNKAKYYLERSIKLNPKHDEAFSKLASVYQTLEVYDTAVKYYERALSLNSSNYLSNVEIGKCYLLSGDTLNAIKSYKNVLKLYSNNNDLLSFAYYNLGVLNFSNNRSKSISYFSKAIAIDRSLRSNLKIFLIIKKSLSVKEFEQYFP